MAATGTTTEGETRAVKKRGAAAKPKTEKKTHPAKPSQGLYQGVLSDDDGLPFREKEIDKAGRDFCEARDQVNEWGDEKKLARAKVEELLIEKKIEGKYYVRHGSGATVFEIRQGVKMSVTTEIEG